MDRAVTRLFPQLLGSAFVELAPRVQELHRRDGTQHYRGEVEVERGRSPLAALCGWATRLPPAGRGPIEVEIIVDAQRERWTRHVGAHAMRSRLWAADGLLHERLGLVEFGFRLFADQGVLKWQVACVRVLGLRLPVRWFAGVAAHEFERDGRYGFDVQAALPLVGPLLRYRGWLDVN